MVDAKKVMFGLLEKGIDVFLEEGKLKAVARKGALDADSVALIKENKEQLIGYLKLNATQGGSDRTPIVRVDRTNEQLPLSFAQQRLWVLDQLGGGSAHYNMPMALEVSGRFDASLAEQAFTRIIARHEPLRTVFTSVDEQPLQVVREAFAFRMRQVDLRAVPPEQQDAMVWEAAHADAVASFDLKSDLMLRASFLLVGESRGVLLFNMHHIASDGWSMALLVKEFFGQYDALSYGRSDPLPPLSIRYADYAQWQREWLVGDVLERQLSYWREQLADLPAVHAIPLDRPRPAQQSFNGVRHTLAIAGATCRALGQLAEQQQATMFMVLHAALSILLSRRGNSSDLVIGTPVANRMQKEVEGIIGFFVNTLVLRTNCAGNPRFTDYLQTVKSINLGAQANQDIPFDYIVERLKPVRSVQYSPVFQIMFAMNAGGGANPAPVDLNAVRFAPLASDRVAAKFELMFTASETAGGLVLDIDYNSDLFDAQTIVRLGDSFDILLKAIVAAPAAQVHTLALLSTPEQDELVHGLNATQLDYARERCIHELFEEQAGKTPDAVAVVFEGAHLTYGQLNAQANRLAHHLRQRGVGAESLVGLCMERSLDMAVGLVAILKAGGAYVPLDPLYPTERLAYMIETSGIEVLLTQDTLRARVAPLVQDHATLDIIAFNDRSLQAELRTHHAHNGERAAGLSSSSLAYVIFTSGSTGKPKGVMIEHRNAVAFLRWASVAFTPVQLAKVLVSTSVCFDLFVFELFAPLSTGGTAVVVHNLFDLQKADFPEKLSLINTVPSVAKTLMHARPSAFDGCTVNLAGEPLDQKFVNELYHAGASQVFDLYGPTESTTYSTYVQRTLDGTGSIGRPVSNTHVYVLNESLQLTPRGVAGELYIGGAGLARGYLNRPDLTAERFVRDPFSADPQARMYKTGDLVRYRADGNLEYIGRIDNQVKIRGFRIELGEIEDCLSRHQEVDASVVLAREDVPGEKRLVAYVVASVASQTGPEMVERLKSHLQLTLPEYMVPALFVFLDVLPLTPNGKIDRKALAAPAIVLSQGGYVAPTTDMERALVAIWADLLHLKAEQISTDTNFFSLGGHSLLVMQVISRLQKMDRCVTAAQIFSAPTVAELARQLGENGEQAARFVASANMIAADCTHITPEMLPLVKLSADEIDTIVAHIPGGAANVQDIYPLAPLQEGMLFHHMISEKNDPSLISYLFKTSDKAKMAAFLSALQFVIDRHDIFRTAVIWQYLSTPVQVVCRQATLPVRWLDLNPGQDALAHMSALCLSSEVVMDVTRAPMMELTIARDGDSERHYVLVQVHHMIIDQEAKALIERDMTAFLTGASDALPVQAPFREFVAHAQHLAATHDAPAFFSGMLGDVTESTAPFGVLDVRGDGSQLDNVGAVVPAEVGGRIRRLAREMGVSPAIIFHAAWALVLAATSGRDDVVFGTIMSGRLQGTSGAGEVIGPMINLLPLRIKLQDINVVDLVKATHAALVALLPYEQAALAQVQRCADLADGAPLFTSMLNYLHASAAGTAAPAQRDVIIEPIAENGHTSYPVCFGIYDFGDAFSIDMHADTSVNPTRMLGYVQNALTRLVTAVQDAPATTAMALSVLPECEQDRLLTQWNQTQADFPRARCMHELFEDHAARTPDAIALVFEDQHLSYAELNGRANRLAHYLVAERAVKPDTLVGICLDRSLEMIVSMLAIFKAGGAYVPLDRAYPSARLAFMLEDASLATVITQTAWLDVLPMNGKQALCLDDTAVARDLQAQPSDNIAPASLELRPDHLAYVIYTSGSSGNPKGVMVAHASLVNLAVAVKNRYQLVPGDGFLQFATINFDMSVEDIFSSMASGSRLVLRTDRWLQSCAQFWQCCAAAHVTVLDLPTAYWHELANDTLSGPPACVRHISVGGEKVNQALVERWFGKQHAHQLTLMNTYGPTECTVDSTMVEIGDTFQGIGKPLPNYSAYVLNRHLGLCPVGVPGELHIGGICLARGYLNRPDLTAQQFIANPFHDEADRDSSARLYKTGDLVRYMEDGNLEYLGRIDDQVKIRGFRIELGEIENCLSQHPAVRSSAVLAREDIPGEKRLVAYITLEQGNGEDMADSVKAYMGEKLPFYMLPALYVVLDQLPLSPNGKVNRKALPVPDLSSLPIEYVAPATETERRLAAIWAELLQLDAGKISARANFFALGGHSLSAIRMVGQVRKQLDIELNIKDLFGAESLATLAVAIEAGSGAATRPKVTVVDRQSTGTVEEVEF
jgi:amino acid adenylation domain-containing protein